LINDIYDGFHKKPKKKKKKKKKKKLKKKKKKKKKKNPHKNKKYSKTHFTFTSHQHFLTKKHKNQALKKGYQTQYLILCKPNQKSFFAFI